MPKHLLSCTLTVGVFCSLGICSDADAAPLPFDVIATSTDPSGWWLDPKWGAQVSSPGMLPDPGACPNSQPWKPACTSVATWEDGSSWKCPGYGPHANFGGATYRGVIAWDEHSSNDDDYNFLLWPFGNAGFTATIPTVWSSSSIPTRPSTISTLHGGTRCIRRWTRVMPRLGSKRPPRTTR